MKILLFSSGYTGIYSFIEQAIEDTLLLLNNTVLKITPENNRSTLEKIEKFNPDLIMTIVGYKMDTKLIAFLKKKGYVLSLWLTEDPFYIDESINLVEDFHYIFTVDLGAFEFYKKKSPEKNFYHLPLGTDPSLYYPLEPPIIYQYDLCLVGYPYPERIELVNHILAKTPYTMILVGPLWKRFIIHKNHTKRLKIINRWTEPESVRNIFNLSKIILNPHRTYNFTKNRNMFGIENKSINNRTFDIAACGGFQLIPNKPDLEMHFNLFSEIVSYSSNEDCINLINKYVNDEKARNYFSKNAKERVLKSHTFLHRIEFILEKIKACSFKKER